MKLATVRVGETTTAARATEDGFAPIEGYPDLSTLLRDPDWMDRARAATVVYEYGNAGEGLGLPLPTPGKIICVGHNYRGHILELGRQLPTHPTLFAKFPETLTGPGEPIVIPEEDPQTDWEGELAVVIGAEAYRVPVERASDAIGGYTIANDVSMRGWQNRTIEWLQGKIWYGSTPLGPLMVTPDEFDATDAFISTLVNGERVQHHAISDMVFSPAALVSYISTMLPLHPGDVILTGTPGGVGHARTPPVYLQPGDRVEVTIDGIGTLSNLMVRANEAKPV
ncbi:fumarylacetoacetate hydrolase family protein [Microbacterium sp. LWH7-1.2]|uniref:fumarylacetoacetate hydrolase family protein n=1 Tax=Microbacterium sp. LWH7-1.2 TaxID=3135257 RepID=UPI0031390D36